MTRPRGFTLVELLVVIAIIGLLSTLAVISLGSIRERARDTKRLSDMRALHQAMEIVKDEKGKYSYACNLVGNDTNGPVMVSNCTSAWLKDYLGGISNFKDPNAPVIVCSLGAPGPCNYSFVGPALPFISATDWRTYFWLEQGTTEYAAGQHYIDPKGIH